MRYMAAVITLTLLVGATASAVDVFTKVEVAQGATKKDAAKKTQPKKNRSAVADVTPEREAAVMAFVKQHHPDLVGLLVNLKQDDKRSYGRAIRDLFAASERLAKSQERDSERYEIDIKSWKAKSRQQYLTAQIKMSDSPKLREQLRETLVEQAELQIEAMELEKRRTAERLAVLEDRLDKLKAAKNKSIESKFNQVVNAKRKAVSDKRKSAATSDAKTKQTRKKAD